MPAEKAEEKAEPAEKKATAEKAEEKAEPAEKKATSKKAEEKAEPAEKKVPAKKAEEKATPADKKAPSDVKQDDPSPEGATVSSAVEQPTIVKASVPRDPLPVTTVIGVPVGIAPAPKATQEGDVPVPSATDGAVIYSKPAPACQLVGGPNKGAKPKPKAPTLADVKPKPPPPSYHKPGLPCSTIVPLAKIDETVPEFAKPREDDNQSCLGMLFSNFYLLFFFARRVFFVCRIQLVAHLASCFVPLGFLLPSCSLRPFSSVFYIFSARHPALCQCAIVNAIFLWPGT